MFDGNVTVAADSIVSDMTCRVNPLRFKQAFGLIPVELMPAVQRVETDLTADLETKDNGNVPFQRQCTAECPARLQSGRRLPRLSGESGADR